MFHKFLIVILVVLESVALPAQEQSGGYENGTNLNVLYRNDASGKLYAHTRGFGILYRKGKHITSKTRSFYEIDLQTLKHPKEIKEPGNADERRRFVYGKINSALLLRGAFGLQNTLFAKADNKAVEVRYSYSIGPTLAFIKPYYVYVYQNGSSQKKLIQFDAENFSPESDLVSGRGSFSDGLSGLAVYPGATAKFNLSFEYAPYTNLIRAIETGFSLDYFPKAISLLARNPSENLIFTFHVGFVFGRKWF